MCWQIIFKYYSIPAQLRIYLKILINTNTKTKWNFGQNLLIFSNMTEFTEPPVGCKRRWVANMVIIYSTPLSMCKNHVPSQNVETTLATRKFHKRKVPLLTWRKYNPFAASRSFHYLIKRIGEEDWVWKSEICLQFGVTCLLMMNPFKMKQNK